MTGRPAGAARRGGPGRAAARSTRMMPPPSARRAPGWMSWPPGPAAEGEAGEGGGDPDAGKADPQPVRNVTDPDSRLMPVRGGGLKQGYNCQDAAADDRLMLGGYASPGHRRRRQADPAGGRRRSRAPPSSPPRTPPTPATRSSWRPATTACAPAPAGAAPGHDIAACHATMTGGIGTIVYDAGYYSEENITAPGADRLIATGKRHTMDTRRPRQPRRRPPARRRHPRPGQRLAAAHPRRPRPLQAPRPRRRRPARQPRGPHRAAPVLRARPDRRHRRVPPRRAVPQPAAALPDQLNPRRTPRPLPAGGGSLPGNHLQAMPARPGCPGGHADTASHASEHDHRRGRPATPEKTATRPTFT